MSKIQIWTLQCQHFRGGSTLYRHTFSTHSQHPPDDQSSPEGKVNLTCQDLLELG